MRGWHRGPLPARVSRLHRSQLLWRHLDKVPRSCGVSSGTGSIIGLKLMEEPRAHLDRHLKTREPIQTFRLKAVAVPGLRLLHEFELREDFFL